MAMDSAGGASTGIADSHRPHLELCPTGLHELRSSADSGRSWSRGNAPSSSSGITPNQVIAKSEFEVHRQIYKE